ncbi:MAG: hypothetical protein KGM47_05345 [Acidobacteriota bacterium]|nr:hypothetical protein [Acidobacteriota bacterium]
MYSCSEVVRSIASDEYSQARLFKKLAIRLHLAMCRHCARYWKELRAIAAAVRVKRPGECEVSHSEIAAVKKRILADLADKSPP